MGTRVPRALPCRFSRLAMASRRSRHPVRGRDPMFDTNGTSDKPQSKIWYNDGLWWCCINNQSTLAIYNLSGGTWTKRVDLQSATNRVLQGGTLRLSLGWGPISSWPCTVARPPKSTNHLRFGESDLQHLGRIPVSIPMLSGSETIVIDKDSTGRLWATYEAGQKIGVVYSTSADHTMWVTTPVVLSGTVEVDDISTIVAFGGDKIGVLWSDQRGQQVSFRVHLDSDPPATWQPRGRAYRIRLYRRPSQPQADSQGRVYSRRRIFRRHLGGTSRSERRVDRHDRRERARLRHPPVAADR